MACDKLCGQGSKKAVIWATQENVVGPMGIAAFSEARMARLAAKDNGHAIVGLDSPGPLVVRRPSFRLNM
eukprot:g32789.t1